MCRRLDAAGRPVLDEEGNERSRGGRGPPRLAPPPPRPREPRDAPGGALGAPGATSGGARCRCGLRDEPPWGREEHLLLGLLHPDCPGLAPEALASFGLTLDDARAHLVQHLGDPFEPRHRGEGLGSMARSLLERAAAVARHLGDEEATSEHLLLAPADRWGQDMLSHGIERRGLDRATLRDRVLALRAARTGLAPPPPPGPALGPWPPPPACPPNLHLAPSPAGHDPWRRRPWGSAIFSDAEGRPLSRGRAVLQYLIDRDGYPVLTTDGRPVHDLLDEDGNEVLDESGAPVMGATDVPPGSRVVSYHRHYRPGARGV